MTPPSPFFSFYPQTLVILNEALSSRQSEATRDLKRIAPKTLLIFFVIKRSCHAVTEEIKPATIAHHCLIPPRLAATPPLLHQSGRAKMQINNRKKFLPSSEGRCPKDGGE